MSCSLLHPMRLAQFGEAHRVRFLFRRENTKEITKEAQPILVFEPCLSYPTIES